MVVMVCPEDFGVAGRAPRPVSPLELRASGCYALANAHSTARARRRPRAAHTATDRLGEAASLQRVGKLALGTRPMRGANRLHLEAELAVAEQVLQDVRRRGAELTRRHEAALDVERGRHEIWAEGLARGSRVDGAAVRIQRFVRGFLARAVLRPILRAFVEARQLEEARSLLASRLLSLQHSVYDLHVLEDHRLRAAVRLQAWWRRVLAQRLVQVLLMYRELRHLNTQLLGSATRIQNVFRCFRARGFCAVLRQLAQQESDRREDQKRARADNLLVRLQAATRSMLACKAIQERRRLVSQELFELKPLPGTPPAEPRDRSRQASPSQSRKRRLGLGRRSPAQASPGPSSKQRAVRAVRLCLKAGGGPAAPQALPGATRSRWADGRRDTWHGPSQERGLRMRDLRRIGSHSPTGDGS